MEKLDTDLAKALLQVQESLDAVAKSGQNSHLKSRYPTLPDVIDELYPKCHEAGLVILQRTLESETISIVRLETTVVHAESGENVSMVTALPIATVSAQAYGGGVTYARRYALMTFFGMHTDDDDGHSATQQPPPQARRQGPDQRTDQRPTPQAQNPSAPAPVPGTPTSPQASPRAADRKAAYDAFIKAAVANFFEKRVMENGKPVTPFINDFIGEILNLAAEEVPSTEQVREATRRLPTYQTAQQRDAAAKRAPEGFE